MGVCKWEIASVVARFGSVTLVKAAGWFRRKHRYGIGKKVGW
jgi:hypothetical protein